jgi:monofunctional biosynthetic peptidoglycan transglycosylase
MRRIAEIALIYVPSMFLLLSISWVLAYKWLPVRWTPLMLIRTIENHNNDEYTNRQIWVSLNEIDPILVESILCAEDQRFYSHSGFDWQELRKMKSDYDHFGKKLRGCSTISQQVAKNCFTFGSRTLFRKIIEAYYTALIELIWGKARILEVYMNIAETGVGIFGVEAACQKYFYTSCDAVDFDDAIALACVLPKPLARTPFIVRIAHSAKVSALSKTVLMKSDKLKD